ncbi:MAG: bifunctional transaldolase/phosoglucose isomerase, partial [Thermoanaerobaculia bacterium]|nr:bifunctional transaldolase/phosoglucose isomerase [Thermoanaerobaculia bacterium]
MNPLKELLEHGQSYWLDNLSRTMLRNGDLERRVREEGLRGVTSNPSIFDKAISGGGGVYDDQVEELVRRGLPVEEIYEGLAVSDVQEACDVLRPVFDESDGADGFVSLEVSPYLVHDTGGTIEEACRLYEAVDRPNVLIKIPGSEAGVPAIEECLYRGVSINVTLLFSIEAYEKVARAHLRALGRRLREGKQVSEVASVASFFLSRIDVLVDQLLGQRIRPGVTSGKTRPEELLGKAAIANARLAYRRFLEIYDGERWETLEKEGARVQRMLWASTSTKNPLYRDVRYVEPLIGSHTVNTLPEKTIRAFADHGRVAPDTVREEIESSRRVMKELEAVGIDFDAVTRQLLNEGMRKFVDPFDDLMRTLQNRREEILGPPARGPEGGEAETSAPVAKGLDALDESRFPSRLHHRDTTLWTADPGTAEAIGNRLGWLGAPEELRDRVEELESFAREIREEGTESVLVLGMGGSSLCPDVASRVFAPMVGEGWPELRVLDSTAPGAIAEVEATLDPGRTLFVVASKSGTTTETLSFYRYFWDRVETETDDDPGEQFVAVTDPDSPLAGEARDRGFRRVFENPPEVGGRYSALTWFGLLPMALMGVDVAELL